MQHNFISIMRSCAQLAQASGLPGLELVEDMPADHVHLLQAARPVGRT